MTTIESLKYFLRLPEADVYAVRTDGVVKFDQPHQRNHWNSVTVVQFPPGAEPKLTWSTQTFVPSGAFRLIDEERASRRFPLELDLDAYERLDDDDRDLYRRDGTREKTPHEVLLTGEPLPMPATERPEVPPGLTWTAAAAYTECYGGAWDHLYPGTLTGYSPAAVISRCGGEFYQHEVRNATTQVRVRMRVWWSPPRFRKGEPVRSRGRKAASAPDVQTWATREVMVPWASSFAGESLDEALGKLRAYEAELTAVLDEAAAVRMCSHCEGHGVVGVRNVNGGLL